MKVFPAAIVVLSVFIAPVVVAACGTENETRDMSRMLDAIVDDARRTQTYTGQDHIDARVLDVMRRVDRGDFVPAEQARWAFENHPLPIGHGQTISQPFIVALMTDLLGLQATHRVLEIGTGSGYQAAILAELAAEIYTIEIIPELAESAKARLAELAYENVFVKAGDGWFGWPEAAPFDAIIVTAVADEVPPKLLDQLQAGGRMVLPVHGRFEQQLIVIEKGDDGRVERRDVLPVRFVPLTGDHKSE